MQLLNDLTNSVIQYFIIKGSDMRKKLLLFVMTLIAIVANAQDRPDILQTCKYFKDGYSCLVERMLLPQETEKEFDELVYGRIWGVISRPSFSAEESVYCVRTASGYKLVMRRAEKNIWYAARDIVYDRIEDENSIRFERNNVRWEDVDLKMKVSETELFITDNQASALKQLISLAVNTSSPMASVIGLDGETTVFFHNGYAAECWSPQDGKLKQLVDITRVMKEAVQKNDNTIIQEILPQVQSLTKEFQKLVLDWAASKSLDIAI